MAAALGGGFGRLFMIVGACLGLFIAGYTGVLLARQQPADLERHLGPRRPVPGLRAQHGRRRDRAVRVVPARRPAERGRSCRVADRYFLLLELALLVVFFVTLGPVATQAAHGGWIALWALVLAGILIPLVMHRAPAGRGGLAVLASILVLIGSFALRTVIVFLPQTLRRPDPPATRSRTYRVPTSC